MNMIKNAVKNVGRVYTPDFIVANILDLAGYAGKDILKKKVIDNSCGDGAFLTEVVKRYCHEALNNGLNTNTLKNDLEEYVFGIDLDAEQCKLCRQNLDNAVLPYGLSNISWNIDCANTLLTEKYNGKMDFVVGNPPYVRVHNLNDLKTVKQFQFSKQGMTDLYIAFFEVGLKMLKHTGILGYITPSSYFNSLAGKALRKHLVENNLLCKLMDLKHNMVFKAVTYNAVSILSKNNKKNEIEYYEYDLNKKNYIFIDNLAADCFYMNDNFYFATKEKLKRLKNILNTPVCSKCNIEVKNGFATLADKFFINVSPPFDEYVIPIIKASTGQQKKCFYPYKNGKLIAIEELNKNINIKKYYDDNKDLLCKRKVEDVNKWWGFGRSQGINDVLKDKYALNTLVKDKKDVKLLLCPAGYGVYSGLYILTDIEFQNIKKAIISDEFIEYISILGKYKNGGYFTYSSKDIKKYLEYYFSAMREEDDGL